MGKKGEGNRQRIIEAADNLFYTNGYHKTSFQDISDATNIPRGNFYYYFKTKDEILDAVVQMRRDGFYEVLDGFDQADSDPRKRLLSFANILKVKEQNILISGCPIGTLSSELAKDDESLQKKSRVVFDLIRKWLEIQLNSLAVNNAEDTAMDILVRMQGISVMACAFQDTAYLQRSLVQLENWIGDL